MAKLHLWWKYNRSYYVLSVYSLHVICIQYVFGFTWDASDFPAITGHYPRKPMIVAVICHESKNYKQSKTSILHFTVAFFRTKLQHCRCQSNRARRGYRENLWKIILIRMGKAVQLQSMDRIGKKGKLGEEHRGWLEETGRSRGGHRGMVGIRDTWKIGDMMERRGMMKKRAWWKEGTWGRKGAWCNKGPWRKKKGGGGGVIEKMWRKNGGHRMGKGGKVT